MSLVRTTLSGSLSTNLRTKYDSPPPSVSLLSRNVCWFEENEGGSYALMYELVGDEGVKHTHLFVETLRNEMTQKNDFGTV